MKTGAGLTVDLEYSRVMLNATLEYLNEPCFKELFLFTGQPGCNIALLETKIPNEGYCFFGWIRLEKKDQTSYAGDEAMRIFKFKTQDSSEIDLSLVDRIFCYTVRKSSHNS